MKRSFRILVGTLSVGLFSLAARADTLVYDTINASGAGYVDSQYGNNLYYVGDTITPSQTGQLTTIKIPFAMSYYNASNTDTAAPFTYIPSIRLDLFANTTDAANNTNRLATATASTTFHHDGVIPDDSTRHYTIEDVQTLTFDYSSLNFTLPSSFVIAYHDDAADGSLGAQGLDVFVRGNATATGFFETYPNNASTDTLNSYAGYVIESQVSIASTPLPTSACAGLGLLAGAGLLRGRRRQGRQTA
jgi:hypothetical protein